MRPQPESPGRRLALLAAGLLLASAANAQPAAVGGVLLPVQDRVGDPALAQRIENAIQDELADRLRRLDPASKRDALRRLRIRDLGFAPPADLRRLARELGASWLLSATLHATSIRPVPQLTLSAQAFRVGSDRMEWAGFAAASGLDTRTWLGLGIVEDLGELAESQGQRLVTELNERQDRRPPPRPRFGRARKGFLSRPLSVAELGRVAVVPFDSVSEPEPAAAAETITRAALAVLHAAGVAVVEPSLVIDIQRRQGRFQLGRIDAATLAALREQAGATMILTGTVELFGTRIGREPEPRLALSARLIDTADGRIVWMDGDHRRGWEKERLFRQGRIYAEGTLVHEMLRALVAGFLVEGTK